MPGGVISTLGDLQIWARALGKGTLLKPRTQRERLRLAASPFLFGPLAATGPSTGVVGGYGLGLVNAGKLLAHNGIYAPPGYNTDLWYLPQQHASVVVLLNSTLPCPGGFLGDGIAVALADVAFPNSLRRVALPPLPCLAVASN